MNNFSIETKYAIKQADYEYFISFFNELVIFYKHLTFLFEYGIIIYT